MTGYNTKVLSIGDVTVTLSKAKSSSAADRLQALLEALGTTIDNELPGGSGGKPTNPIAPGAGTKPIDPDAPTAGNELPGAQPGPDQGLPGGKPARPDQGLPGEQPEVDNDLPQLADFLKTKAKEIAAEVLKGTLCDPAKPK